LTCSGGASGAAGTVLQSGFTCKVGFVAYTYSAGIGCLSCKGLASASANGIADANIFSCTAPASAATL